MLTYKELQLNLKAFKEVGHVLQVKLNAKREVLEEEYIRLQAVEQLEYAASQSELPQIEEVEEDMSILPLEGVASLTAQYSMVDDTTYVNTTKGKVSWLSRALCEATTKEEEQLEQQMYATEQIVRATNLTESVFDDLWENTVGVADSCMQEIVEVPKCYQLCLPPAPDSIQDRVPNMVHPLIVFLLPSLMFLLILNLSIKILSGLIQLSIPFVLQRCKPKLTGYFSTKDSTPLFT